MLSYQHGYHAGNFADVHKHLVFSLVLDYLRQKPAAMTVMDVYAGAGEYLLDSARARKTGEAELGIKPLWQSRPWPQEARAYEQALAAMNLEDTLRHYPGSPLLARHWLRPGDDHILCELHPQELEQLKTALSRHATGEPTPHVHRRDALEAMTGLTPPLVRRGCILVDPSYENRDEYHQVARTVRQALTRWPEATWLVWYPLLAGRPHAAPFRPLAGLGKRGTLTSEISVREPGAGMHGSGMLVINPPWTLPDGLRACHDWLGALGQNGPAKARLDLETAS